ncbi:unnamed protein product, partial [Ranitomeya imitator]
MAASGTGSLVFMDDVTQDRSSQMNSEVFRAILCAQIQPNAAKLIGRRFILQMDNDPKHKAKATQEFIKAKKWNILEWPMSVSFSCTQSVSVIILYPKCQRHYPVPQVSVSLPCTPSVSVIILYPKCQCHYPVPQVSVPLSCTRSISVTILYPKMSSSSEEEQRTGPAQAEYVSEVSTHLLSLVPEQDEDLIENDLLISLVHERVLLWDTRVLQHSDNMTIRRLWNELAKAMRDGWDNARLGFEMHFVMLKVKTLWRSLKDRFNKDLRQESRVPSGPGARIRQYKYHHILAFLRPVLAQRTTWSSTLDHGSGAVLHQTATDPSQPSSSAAASRPATLTEDQEAGPS